MGSNPLEILVYCLCPSLSHNEPLQNTLNKWNMSLSIYIFFLYLPLSFLNCVLNLFVPICRPIIWDSRRFTRCAGLWPSGRLPGAFWQLESTIVGCGRLARYGQHAHESKLRYMSFICLCNMSMIPSYLSHLDLCWFQIWKKKDSEIRACFNRSWLLPYESTL